VETGNANPEFSVVAQLAVLLRRVQARVMPLKHSKCQLTLTQAKKPATSLPVHSGRLEHQLLHHRLDETTLK